MACEGDVAIVVAPSGAAAGSDPVGQQPLRRAAGIGTREDLSLAERPILLAGQADEGQPVTAVAPGGFRIVAFAVGDLHQLTGVDLEHPDLREAVVDETDTVLFVAQAADHLHVGGGNAGVGPAALRVAHRGPAHAGQAAAVGRPVEPGHGVLAERVGLGLTARLRPYPDGAIVGFAPGVGEPVSSGAPAGARGVAAATADLHHGVAVQLPQVQLGLVAVGGRVHLANGIGHSGPLGIEGHFGQPAEVEQILGDEAAADAYRGGRGSRHSGHATPRS